MSYQKEIAFAFACEDVSRAVEAYTALRRAITATDDMSADALAGLQARVERAAHDMTKAVGRSNVAMVKVLDAYSDYLGALMWEADCDSAA